MPDISIVDTRNIIKFIRNKYHYDLSNYAITQLRFRIDEVISRHNITNPGLLISQLFQNDKFFDEFLYDISIPQTELFRDPEMWISLRERVLPILIDHKDLIHIWFPDCTDINDILSMFFIADEAGILEKFKFSASSLSGKMIRELEKGRVIQKYLPVEIQWENFTRANPEATEEKFSDLTTPGSIYRDNALRKVGFYLQDLSFNPFRDDISLIIFRNKLLNYSPEYQNLIFAKLAGLLQPGGVIILGYRENVGEYLSKNPIVDEFVRQENIFFKPVNEEKIDG